VFCHTAQKVTQQFLRQNTPDFMLMDGHHIFQILVVYITAFGISCRIWFTMAYDFRFQIYRISKRQSKTSRGGLTETVRESICTVEWKKRLNAVRKKEWRRDSAHFPLIAVTEYRSHAVRRLEIITYFVRFGQAILFCVFLC